MISIFPLSNTYLNIYADGCEFSISADSAALLTVNIQNSTLSINHSHSLEEIGAAAASHSHTLAEIGAAAENHTHTLAALGAAAASHTHSPFSLGAAYASHSHVGVYQLFSLTYQGNDADNIEFNWSATIDNYAKCRYAFLFPINASPSVWVRAYGATWTCFNPHKNYPSVVNYDVGGRFGFINMPSDLISRVNSSSSWYAFLAFVG